MISFSPDFSRHVLWIASIRLGVLLEVGCHSLESQGFEFFEAIHQVPSSRVLKNEVTGDQIATLSRFHVYC